MVSAPDSSQKACCVALHILSHSILFHHILTLSCCFQSEEQRPLEEVVSLMTGVECSPCHASQPLVVKMLVL